MVSAVIIANSDFGDYASALIDSILFHEQKIEIILIDNASRKPYRKNARYNRVRLNEPVGYSKALNIGAKESSGDWLLFLNDDVLTFDRFTQKIERLDRNAIYGLNIRTKKPKWGTGFFIHYLHGWLQVMHRKIYKKIGPFDENLKYFGLDDIDFGWRAEQLGIKIKVVDFPFVHIDVHRRMKRAGFYEQMEVSKQYFIEKVKKEREKNVR